jgi:hypothetical protein
MIVLKRTNVATKGRTARSRKLPFMPFCKCPKCKAIFTVQVADTKAWFAEKWPGYAASELVPEICAACERQQKAMDLAAETADDQNAPPYRYR